MKKTISLLLWIITFQIIGFFIGYFSQTDITTWYPTLHKSTLTPPNITFPIVWTILYIMLAIAGWSLWYHRNNKTAQYAFIFFSIQMIMNWLWTPLFFNLHWLRFAFFWLIGIIIFTALTLSFTRQKFKLATAMLIPYFCWLLFAAYLNGVIYYYAY